MPRLPTVIFVIVCSVTAMACLNVPSSQAEDKSVGTRGIKVKERLPQNKATPDGALSGTPLSPTLPQEQARPAGPPPSLSSAAPVEPGQSPPVDITAPAAGTVSDGESTTATSPTVTSPAAEHPTSGGASTGIPLPKRPQVPGVTTTHAPPPGSAVPSDVVTGPGNVQVSTANPAGVALELVGGKTAFRVGESLLFKVSTQKAGYLVIMDIAADGMITQIYPNVISLVARGQDVNQANYIRPGTPVLVPDPNTDLTNFDFVAAPPAGSGLLVAMLSDKPVQIVDLPAVPPDTPKRLEFVQQATRSLKITPAGGGPLLDPRWSFDAQTYIIQE